MRITCALSISVTSARQSPRIRTRNFTKSQRTGCLDSQKFSHFCSSSNQFYISWTIIFISFQQTQVYHGSIVIESYFRRNVCCRRLRISSTNLICWGNRMRANWGSWSALKGSWNLMQVGAVRVSRESSRILTSASLMPELAEPCRLLRNLGLVRRRAIKWDVIFASTYTT